jgi:hypothetical protein
VAGVTSNCSFPLKLFRIECEHHLDHAAGGLLRLFVVFIEGIANVAKLALDTQRCGYELHRRNHLVGRNILQNLQVRNNHDGTFEDISKASGVFDMPPESRRGAAFGDVYNDGNIDILVLNIGQAPSLLINRIRNSNHRVAFHLIGTKSNRAAIGARITIHATGVMQFNEFGVARVIFRRTICGHTSAWAPPTRWT